MFLCRPSGGSYKTTNPGLCFHASFRGAETKLTNIKRGSQVKCLGSLCGLKGRESNHALAWVDILTDPREKGGRKLCHAKLKNCHVPLAPQAGMFSQRSTRSSTAGGPEPSVRLIGDQKARLSLNPRNLDIASREKKDLYEDTFKFNGRVNIGRPPGFRAGYYIRSRRWRWRPFWRVPWWIGWSRRNVPRTLWAAGS